MNADLDRRFGLVILRRAEVVQDLGPALGRARRLAAATAARCTADQTWVRPSFHLSVIGTSAATGRLRKEGPPRSKQGSHMCSSMCGVDGHDVAQYSNTIVSQMSPTD